MSSISFTLSSGCPMMCSYCPQKKYINEYSNISGIQHTSLEDFKVMLDNVDHLVKNLNFGGFTEPLVNPECYEIVKYAKEAGYVPSMNTTLYNINEEDLLRLLDLRIVIKVHFSDSKLKVDPKIYETFFKNRKKWTVLMTFTEEGQSLLDPELSNKKMKIGEYNSRGGNLDIPHKVIKGPVRCHKDIYLDHVILPNGDVSICCMDFGLDYVVGNLLGQTLEEIRNSAEVEYFKECMLMGNPNFICNNCSLGRPIK